MVLLFFFSAPVCLQGLGVGLLYMAVSRQRGECCIGRQRSNSCTVQFPRYATEGGWPNPSHALSYGAGVWLGTVGSRGIREEFHGGTKPSTFLWEDVSSHLAMIKKCGPSGDAGSSDGWMQGFNVPAHFRFRELVDGGQVCLQPLRPEGTYM